MGENGKVGIVMCTWRRVERLHITLDLLTKQTNRNFIFYIWNNNVNEVDNINYICEKYVNSLTIEIFHSDVNVGGMGRFLYSKKQINVHDKFIYIDDDQEFSENMVNIFLSEYDENAIKSRWSWRFNNDTYTNRKKISISDVKVHYCGTGGMILPSKIFSYDELYKIPKEFQFVEDLWISYIAHHHMKMDLISITDNFITNINDNKNLTSDSSFYNVKNKFLKHLINERGWNILKY